MRRVLAVVTSFAIGFGSAFRPAVLSAQNSAPIAPARPTTSPFAPEAIRRAVSAAIASDAQAQDADGKKWAKVIGIRPGAEATVTVAGGTPMVRIVLGADESSLTLMKEADDSIPIDARDAIRSMVSLNPERLISLKDAGSYTDPERQVRFSPDGVFVKERKVALLSDLILRVDRRNVLEVRRGGPGGKAFRILGGFFLGYLGFGYAAQAIDDDSGVSTAAVVSGLAGGVALAILFNKLGTSVIYRR